jgi:hypothetical protein
MWIAGVVDAADLLEGRGRAGAECVGHGLEEKQRGLINGLIERTGPGVIPL